MNENRNTFEKEINLIEVMFYCLRQWRWIVATMFILAVSAGAYKYVSVGKSNQLKIEQWNNVEKEEKEIKTVTNPVVEYFRQGIAGNEQELKRQGEYIENSLVMQLDSNHLQIGVLNFHLNIGENVDEEDTLRVLIEAYRTFVMDGELAKKIIEVDNSVDISDLQYLISFRDGIEMGEEDTIKTVPVKQDVIQVRVIASEEKICSNYMNIAKISLLEYNEQLKKEFPSHTLDLLAATQSVGGDKEIRKYQYEILNNYRNIANNLYTMNTSLEKIIDEEGETITTGQSLTLEDQIANSIKFAVIGLILGVCLSIFILVLFYLMSNKLQGVAAFEEEFGIQLLGRVTLPLESKRWFGFLDKWIFRLKEGIYASVPLEEQVKIVSASLKAIISKEENMKKIMLAGTIPSKEVEEVCKLLQKDIADITLSNYMQVTFSAEAFESLSNYDGILFLEKREVSVSKFIYQERNFANEQGVKILGAVVL